MVKNNISDELKIYELSLIWKEAEYNFAFWEQLNGKLDWNEAYKRALSAVLKTKNTYEYYLELKKFVALLRDGHTGVWYPKEVTQSAEYMSKLPIRTMLIEDKYVIVNVKRCVADKVKQWSIIKKIDGIDIDSYIEKNIYPYIWHEKKDSAYYSIDYHLRSGAEGSIVELEVEFEDEIETIALTRTKGDSDWEYTDVELRYEKTSLVYNSDSHSIAMTVDNIAIITIDTFMNNNLPKEIYANFSLLEKAKGYIIDIRKNDGGNSSNADAVAAMFLDKGFVNQRARHPIYIGVYKAWAKDTDFKGKTYEELATKYGDSEWLKKLYHIPKHEYYEESITNVNIECPNILKGPLVVLSSAETGSAAEDFLIEIDNAERATIVGSASYGSTGQPLSIELKSGGGFRICTIHSMYPNGKEFINIGVTPHITVDMTVNDYQNNVDAVMNRALNEIRKK